MTTSIKYSFYLWKPIRLEQLNTKEMLIPVVFIVSKSAQCYDITTHQGVVSLLCFLTPQQQPSVEMVE